MQGQEDRLRSFGTQVVDSARKVLHEGNVRRVMVTKGGRTIVQMPLTVGVVAAAFAPTITALGAVVAVATGSEIRLERTDSGEPQI